VEELPRHAVGQRIAAPREIVEPIAQVIGCPRLRRARERILEQPRPLGDRFSVGALGRRRGHARERRTQGVGVPARVLELFADGRVF
jgi:hypothetical protein